MTFVGTRPWGSSSDATSLHLSWYLPLSLQLCPFFVHIALASLCLVSVLRWRPGEQCTALLISYPEQAQYLTRRCWPNTLWMRERETYEAGVREGGIERDTMIVTSVGNFSLSKVWNGIKSWDDMEDKMTALTVDLCFRVLSFAYIQTDSVTGFN